MVSENTEKFKYFPEGLEYFPCYVVESEQIGWQEALIYSYRRWRMKIGKRPTALEVSEATGLDRGKAKGKVGIVGAMARLQACGLINEQGDPVCEDHVMAAHFRRHPKGYVTFPYYRMTGVRTALLPLVLSRLVNLAESSVRTNYERLAGDFGCSVNSMKANVERLVTQGYIASPRIEGSRGGSTLLYTIPAWSDRQMTAFSPKPKSERKPKANDKHVPSAEPVLTPAQMTATIIANNRPLRMELSEHCKIKYQRWGLRADQWQRVYNYEMHENTNRTMFELRIKKMVADDKKLTTDGLAFLDRELAAFEKYTGIG